MSVKKERNTAIMTKSFHAEAKRIRTVGGYPTLEKTLKKTVMVLANNGIPHWVAGCYAVQERGWPRYGRDVDLIVPDVAQAREKLTANGYQNVADSPMTLTQDDLEIWLL